MQVCLAQYNEPFPEWIKFGVQAGQMKEDNDNDNDINVDIFD